MALSRFSIAAAARCFLEERPKFCASPLILTFTVLCAAIDGVLQSVGRPELAPVS